MLALGRYCWQIFLSSENLVLYRDAFMHVWYVDKEMEQNSRQGEVPAISFVWYSANFTAFQGRIYPFFRALSAKV